ncbi:MAG TPA: glycosyltransferase family 4 protein [Chthoniobacterales bacterium]|nr:glycosyltransferase family 4 protein [Chthoniobacterales bacterium]
MKIVTFINQLGLGGSEKAAGIWARELVNRGHQLHLISFADGPRRSQFENAGVSVQILPAHSASIANALSKIQPDAIHAHVPGHAHQGDVLGEALQALPKKIPILQTNIFGQLENPKENEWTDFRLFISWTSCVQATRRYFKSLDEEFFRRASVAVYPLDPDDGPSASERENFRRLHGIKPDEILFGRLSRPEPNKWTDLAVDAFRIAAAQNPHIKLLLREPPPAVAQSLKGASDCERFIVLPATSDPAELALTTASLDVVLHTSSVGESFGYGIAEPMNYGKPVIANSTPWLDQAQIELVRHGECGFIASTASTVAKAILTLADDVDLRTKLGHNAQSHIRTLSNPSESTRRLETILEAAVTGASNPNAQDDLKKARAAGEYLDEQQFGHSPGEQISLRPKYYWARFHQWRFSRRSRP